MDVKNASAEKTNLVQRGKKVPERGFFSLSVFLRMCVFSFLFSTLLCGCFFAEKNEAGSLKDLEEKSQKKMTSLQEKRVLRFLLVENGDFVLAYRAMMAAGEQLNLTVRVTWTFPEHISPMLRADKADIAYYGKEKISSSELRRLLLDGHTLILKENENKKHHIPFVMNRGSAELWSNLEKAIQSSASNGGISFEMPEREDLEPEKKEKKIKKEEKKRSIRKPKAKKKSSKHERIRRKIFREAGKRKEQK